MAFTPNSQSLREFCNQRFFANWDTFVADERIAAAERIMQQLVAEFVIHPQISAEIVRAAVGRCVERFNEIDDTWICTIERDDICEAIFRIVTAAGGEWNEELLGGRDW